MSTIKTNTIQPTAAGNNLIFANGSAAEAMRITDAGLVGVGTNNPVSKLHIKIPSGGGTSLSDMNLLSNYSLVLDATAAVGSGSTPGYNSAGIAFAATSQNATQPFASIFYGGQANGGSLNFATSTTYANGLNNINMCMHNGLVGIGTVSPASPLHIKADTLGSIEQLRLEGIGTQSFMRFNIGGTNQSYIGHGVLSGVGTGMYLINQVNSPLYIGTSDQIKLTITGAGNVGIGTTTPTVALDVAGEARSSISTTVGSNAKTLVTKDYVDEFPKVRAWVTFTGTGTGVFGTNLPIRNSYRVATVTHISLGNYLINFSASQSTVNYCVSICHSPTNGGHHAPVITSMTSTSVGIFISKDISASYPGYNPETVCVSILY